MKNDSIFSTTGLLAPVGHRCSLIPFKLGQGPGSATVEQLLPKMRMCASVGGSGESENER